MSFYRIHPGARRRRSPRRLRGWRARPVRWSVHPSRWRSRAQRSEPALEPQLVPAPPNAAAVLAQARVAPPKDRASARVREAGGPIDEASYSCDCGYVFCAPVSTTVACPNCGATQAW
jgi:hypothetical protein